MQYDVKVLHQPTVQLGRATPYCLTEHSISASIAEI
jgi:hypothetical protein